MPEPKSPRKSGPGQRHAVLLLSPTGHVLAANTEATSFSSFEGDELIGRDFLSIYAPEDCSRPLVAQALRDAVDGKKSVLADRDLMGRDGERLRSTITMEALASPDGMTCNVLVTVFNHSGSPATEERLRESERRFRLFVNAVADHAICMLDTRGIILDWNLGAQRMTQFRLEDIEGKHYGIFFPEHDRIRSQPDRLLDRAVLAGRVEYETDLHRNDGESYPACVTLESVQDSQGKVLGFACIIRDVTNQRLMEHRLREAHEQMAHAQKVEAIGQLTGGIAHDFNNALQGIVSSLEIASVYLERNTPEKTAQYLSVALDAAKRAGGLTQRLLGMARKQSGAGHRLPVGTLLQSLRDVLVRVVGDSISLRLDIEDDLPPIACDSGQLESVVLNLAINARDAMGSKGILTLKARRRAADAPSDDGQLSLQTEISVIDNGKGMDEEVLRRACEPFFTTKTQGHGTGLGLAMVSGFVAQHGGTLEINSTPGHGTHVSMIFPAELSGDPLEGCDARPPQELEGLRVLVVENDDAVRSSMAERLTQLGCHVFEAATGREALLTLAACPSWDLLLSDIDLPELDGHEVCREARTRFPRLRVILMTGYVDSELVTQEYADKQISVLIKPFDMGALLNKVRLLLHGN